MAVEISSAESADESLVSISVADNGVGIPVEAQDHVFEPFFRVAGTETQRGEFSTGLGLALAKKLVQAQSGEISFESEPGKGSDFTVSLPIARGRKAVGNRKVRATAGRPTRPSRGGGRRELAQARAS